jgi:hypothetical protein
LIPGSVKRYLATMSKRTRTTTTTTTTPRTERRR